MRAAILSIFFVLLLPMTAFAAVEVGKAAPDFSLKSADGTQYSVKELKGKTIVLEWFNKSCPFVKKHYKDGDMQALQKEYASKEDIVWLVIDSTNSDHNNFIPVEKQSELKAELGINATAILSDASGEVGKLYGAKTTPHMYVIDKNGTLVYQGAIDDNKSVFADPKESKNYVKLALDELAAAKSVSTPETKPYGCSVKYAD